MGCSSEVTAEHRCYRKMRCSGGRRALCSCPGFPIWITASDGFPVCWMCPLHPGATLHPAAGLSAKTNITTRLNTAFPKALSPWVPPENKRMKEQTDPEEGFLTGFFCLSRGTKAGTETLAWILPSTLKTQFPQLCPHDPTAVAQDLPPHLILQPPPHPRVEAFGLCCVQPSFRGIWAERSSCEHSTQRCEARSKACQEV